MNSMINLYREETIKDINNVLKYIFLRELYNYHRLADKKDKMTKENKQWLH